MNLWYANIEMAMEGLLGDSIESFLPSGQQSVQVTPYMRQEWSRVFARGNRVHTIPVTLHLRPEANTGKALLRLSKFFGSLPKEGKLVWEESGEIAVCENAALNSFNAVYRRGVAVAMSLTFTGGEIATGTWDDIPGGDLTNYIATEDGSYFVLED